MRSIVHAFFGLSLQSYTIPGSSTERIQRRLYVSAGTCANINGRNLDCGVSIFRINLNELERRSKDSYLKVVSENDEAWKSITVPIVPFSKPQSRFSRLAYGDGTLYYMAAPPGLRYTLQKTDVTVAINCGHSMPLVKQAFRNWNVKKSEFGNGLEATERALDINLHETSPFTKPLPWRFKAYKKVIQFKNQLIVKEMLCSQPKPPTTRPSQESCCVDKRSVDQAGLTDTKNQATCSLAQVIRQF